MAMRGIDRIRAEQYRLQQEGDIADSTGINGSPDPSRMLTDATASLLNYYDTHDEKELVSVGAKVAMALDILAAQKAGL